MTLSRSLSDSPFGVIGVTRTHGKNVQSDQYYWATLGHRCVLLVVWPGATSSALAPSSDALCY